MELPISDFLSRKPAVENIADSQPPDAAPLVLWGFTPGHVSLGLLPANDWATGVLDPSHSCQIRDSSKGKHCLLQSDALLPSPTFPLSSLGLNLYCYLKVFPLLISCTSNAILVSASWSTQTDTVNKAEDSVMNLKTELLRRLSMSYKSSLVTGLIPT